ncbi:MAG: GFA family protein [Wenzhouxiangellaceae bacterium]
MTDSPERQGQCLCGACQLTTKTLSTDIGVCHCAMCRRWTGGPLLAVDCSTEVTLNGDDNIGTYSSSDWAERGFCQRCGTHLFYRLKATGQYIVPAGLFGDNVEMQLHHQIFIEEKPAYYDFAQQTPTMTGAEVFAQFAAED